MIGASPSENSVIYMNFEVAGLYRNHVRSRLESLGIGEARCMVQGGEMPLIDHLLGESEYVTDSGMSVTENNYDHSCIWQALALVDVVREDKRKGKKSAFVYSADEWQYLQYFQHSATFEIPSGAQFQAEVMRVLQLLGKALNLNITVLPIPTMQYVTGNKLLCYEKDSSQLSGTFGYDQQPYDLAYCEDTGPERAIRRPLTPCVKNAVAGVVSNFQSPDVNVHFLANQTTEVSDTEWNIAIGGGVAARVDSDNVVRAHLMQLINFSGVPIFAVDMASLAFNRRTDVSIVRSIPSSVVSADGDAAAGGDGSGFGFGGGDAAAGAGGDGFGSGSGGGSSATPTPVMATTTSASSSSAASAAASTATSPLITKPRAEKDTTCCSVM